MFLLFSPSVVSVNINDVSLLFGLLWSWCEGAPRTRACSFKQPCLIIWMWMIQEKSPSPYRHLSWAQSRFSLNTTSTLTTCAGCPFTSHCTSATPCPCPWMWANPCCLRCRPTHRCHHHECHLSSACLGSSHPTEQTRLVWRVIIDRPFHFTVSKPVLAEI